MHTDDSDITVSGDGQIVLVASANHTGTWFVIEFFRSFDDIGHFVELTPLIKSPTFLRKRISEGSYTSGVRHDTVNLIHGHLTKKLFPLLAALTYMNFRPTFIPIRDPLAAIITEHNRRPGRHAAHITDQFCALVEQFYDQPQLVNMMIPLDLLALCNESFRLKALRAIAVAACLYQDEICRKWAREWPYHNSRGDYPLKRMYLQNDIKSLCYESKELGEDIGYLRSKEGIIEPMMTSMGYPPLLWYSDSAAEKARKVFATNGALFQLDEDRAVAH